MRFQEGRAWFSRCPRCERPVLEAHVEGLKLRLSTKAIPTKDAAILSKYLRIVTNIWVGETQLYVTAWFGMYGPPDRGRLYIQHICNAWN
jgi:hypothetical protein